MLVGATIAARGAARPRRIADETLGLFDLRDWRPNPAAACRTGIQRLVGMAIACADRAESCSAWTSR